MMEYPILTDQIDIIIRFNWLKLNVRHWYYGNRNTCPVYFLNIPKSGSTYIKESLLILENKKQKPISFCLLRDPIDRFISGYFHCLFDIDQLDDFVNCFFIKKDLSMFGNVKRRGVEHLAPQTFFVESAPPQYKTNCSYLRFEDFFQDPEVNFLDLGLTLLEKPSANKIGIGFASDEQRSKLKDLVVNGKHKNMFDEFFAQDKELIETLCYK